jgi:hypothetical protein
MFLFDLSEDAPLAAEGRAPFPLQNQLDFQSLIHKSERLDGRFHGEDVLMIAFAGLIFTCVSTQPRHVCLGMCMGHLFTCKIN